MGTRGLTGFIADGKWFVTYNHYDSYPEYLGMKVLEFCKQVADWDALREKVLGLCLVSSETDVPTENEMEYYLGYYHNPNADEHPIKDWYWLLRSLQGEQILYETEKGNVKHMIDDHTFMGDSIFCEWSYVVDLDEMKLRVYKGFQKVVPDKNTILPPDICHNSICDNYYPVKMLYAYSLDELPEFMLGVTNEFKEKYRAGQIVWE